MENEVDAAEEARQELQYTVARIAHHLGKSVCIDRRAGNEEIDDGGDSPYT
jgi:hypothetical protein